MAHCPDAEIMTAESVHLEEVPEGIERNLTIYNSEY
jgi:hypothetical protein